MPHAVDRGSQIARIVAAMKVSRAEFLRIHDEVARSRSGDDILEFKIVGLGLDDEAAFRAAFEQAAAQGWLSELTGAFLRADALDMEGGRTGGASVAPGEPASIQVAVQAITSADLGFLRPEDLTRGMLIALRRVCRVTVEGSTQTTGTGFLIGPQAILTAWHVVAPLLDAGGDPLPGSASRISVEFDRYGTRPGGQGSSYGVVADWLGESSKCHPREMPTVDGKDKVGLRAPEEESPRFLDFAVVRLDATPGRERGFYRLDPNRLAGTGHVSVVQLPGQFNLRVAQGQFQGYWPEQARTQILHDANTDYSSSGAPCLDRDFEVIGMHRCRFHNPQSGSAVNGATAVPHIAGKLARSARVMGVPDYLWALDDAWPIIGRDNVQRLAWEMLNGVTRIVSLHGDRHVGKSFCIKVLKQFLFPDEHLLIEIPAAQVPADASDVAALILGQAEGYAAAGRPLPTADGLTAFDAWLRGTLMPAFLERLIAAAGRRIVWLVIDELEHNALPDATCRNFLELLYAQCRSVTCLRIVLVGLDGPVPAAPSDIVAVERLRPFDVGDIELYLQRRMTAKGLPVMREECQRLAIVASSALDVMAAQAVLDPKPTYVRGVSSFLAHVLSKAME